MERLMSSGKARPRCAAQRGYTYLLLLFLVASSSVGLAVAGEWWYRDAIREKERELLFAGEQFAAAIGRYYEQSPNAPQLPRSLDDLLHDRRYAGVRRHLRRIYLDPMTGTQQWGLVRNSAGGIVGVHSRHAGRPLRRAGFPAGREGFAAASDYTGWRFVYYPGAIAQGK